MTKAVFVSSCGDPFITLLAHKLFKERWYDEADTFYINLNNHCGVPQDVIQEFCSKITADPKVHLIYHPRGIGNGRPITEMTLVSREDLVMLLEDDGFIFDSGIVSKCFQDIESDLCDAVGSPRFSCGTEIGEALQKKYNLDYSGYGDQGPNFWPCFFFCKREDLLKTDLDFSSKTFLPGEYSKEMDHTFKEVNHGDTFVWTCIQMRANGVRFHHIPQVKADPYELESKERKEMNWYPQFQPVKWIHGGSLSAGWGGYLSGRVPDVSADISKREIESRVAFWVIASDVIDGFEEFKVQYRAGIEQLITQADLDRGKIQAKVKFYKELMRL